SRNRSTAMASAISTASSPTSSRDPARHDSRAAAVGAGTVPTSARLPSPTGGFACRQERLDRAARPGHRIEKRLVVIEVSPKEGLVGRYFANPIYPDLHV